MAAHYDLDFVSFQCQQSCCREVYEKSRSEVAGVGEVFCPRCGQPVRIADGARSQAAAGAAVGRS